MFVLGFRVEGGVRMLLVGFRVGFKMLRNVVGWV